MKIAIFSDCHCGFDFGKERGEDPFLGLEEAVRGSLDADLMLIAGDMFDSRIVKQEVFARAAKILALPHSVQGRAQLVDVIGKPREELSPLALRGVPVIAIHGTHERRSRHLVNPVQELEHAGLLIHLHCSSVVYNIGEQKVAVHGMSGVPERFAKDCLMSWDPRPVPGAINILMIHQSIEPYIYSPLEPPSLKVEDLPAGFDLYVLGHIHWSDCRPFHAGKLLVCGSTTPTSLHKNESEKQKGYHVFDGRELAFVPLESQRKVLWKEFFYGPGTKDEMRSFLSQLPDYKRKPIFVAKIRGKLQKGAAPPVFTDIENAFSGKVLLNISRKFETEEFDDNTELLEDLRKERLSPEEHGMKLLLENLGQTKCGIKADEIFDLLVEGETDLIFNLLTGKQKTLGASG
ncbi:MAG: metallophosphoesterase [Candidatus Aenigmatarchaeota archaeon]